MTTKNYRYQITFDAPLPFVFRWCTDFAPGDARLEGEEYERRILKRARGRIIYEDLASTPGGWNWKRNTVDLRPPASWHCESVGNYRLFRLDYRLKALSDGRTQLTITGRRTPTGVGGPNPSASAFAKDMETSWRSFRRNLEREAKRRGA